MVYYCPFTFRTITGRIEMHGKCETCGQTKPAPKTCPTCGQEVKKVKGGWGDCILWKNPCCDRVATLKVYALLGTTCHPVAEAIVQIHDRHGNKLHERRCFLDQLPATIRKAQRWAENHFGVDVS